MSGTAREYVEMHPWGDYTALVGTEPPNAHFKWFTADELMFRMILVTRTEAKMLQTYKVHLYRRMFEGCEIVDVRRVRGGQILFNHWPHGLPEGAK